MNLTTQAYITSKCATIDKSIQNYGICDPMQTYKQDVLNRPRAREVNYLQKSTMDGMSIDTVIHTERPKDIFLIARTRYLRW